MRLKPFLYSLFLLTAPGIMQTAEAQEHSVKLPQKANLQDLIDFALDNRATVQQALLDEEIGEREIASALSGWYPQIGATGTYNYNIKTPAALAGAQPHQSGVILQADQQLLNPGLMQASKAAKYIRLQNAQNTEENKINTIVAVSKAYYDILTSQEQLQIIHENLLRIEKQLSDAKARYETGLVDKTDFKRAEITLGNTRADQKRVTELLHYKYAYLKELIGLDPTNSLALSSEENYLESEMHLDTLVVSDHSKRIEFQRLQTFKQLQTINTQYNKWKYLPSLSAYYNHGWDFSNDRFSNLYNQNFPRSMAGLTLSIPIFQGTKRIQEVKKSQLQEQRIDWDLINLQNQINTQFELAMATYKANHTDWTTAKYNMSLAEEVYNTIKLQYDEGIKTYLDLMTSETDLRTAQINYLNSLLAVLSGKLDVQQALGIIKTDQN